MNTNWKGCFLVKQNPTTKRAAAMIADRFSDSCRRFLSGALAKQYWQSSKHWLVRFRLRQTGMNGDRACFIQLLAAVAAASRIGCGIDFCIVSEAPSHANRPGA